MPTLQTVPVSARGHDELDRVTIRHTLPDLFGGAPVPAGSTGTIVSVAQPGVCYLVEFVHPQAALVSVMHDHLA